MKGIKSHAGRKVLHLKNEQDRKLTVTLREYRPGDEEGMIACIRDEYGDTYFKRGFYEPVYIKEESDNGHIMFLVAQTKAGEIAGMLILKNFKPAEDMCEIASQIFRVKYRGYGLAMPFFEYADRIVSRGDYSAAYCLPVLFHDVTQRLLYRLGLHAVGLVLNVFDMDKITHSYHNGKNTKHSQGIQIRAMSKQDAGTVYLPKEHREFGKKIYKVLGVKFNMEQDIEDSGEYAPPVSLISFWQNELQKNLEICVHLVGLDLAERIDGIHKKYPLKEKQTSNIFLNCSNRNAVWAYRILKGAGYFFSGLKPLCGKNEYMVMHNPGEVKIYFEDYVVSDEFEVLLHYIQKAYEDMYEQNEDRRYSDEKEKEHTP